MSFEKEFLIESGTGKISVLTFGNGLPILIAPVPWGISSIKWSFFLGLRDKYKFIFVDPRGIGKSSPVSDKQEFSIDCLVDDLFNVQKYFGLEKIFCIGSSAGGFTAMKYAIKHQELVSKLIVICSSPTGNFHKGTIRDKNHPRHFEINDIVKKFRNNFNAENFREYMIKVYQMDIATEDGKEEIILEFGKVNISIERYKYFATIELNKYNIINQLKELKMPALIIGAEQDIHVSPNHSMEIHKQIVNSELEILENCGHFPFIDDKIKMEKLFSDFLI